MFGEDFIGYAYLSFIFSHQHCQIYLPLRSCPDFGPPFVTHMLICIVLHFVEKVIGCSSSFFIQCLSKLLSFVLNV